MFKYANGKNSPQKMNNVLNKSCSPTVATYLCVAIKMIINYILNKFVLRQQIVKRRHCDQQHILYRVAKTSSKCVVHTYTAIINY